MTIFSTNLHWSTMDLHLLATFIQLTNADNVGL
jgi:hypothetical protein